MLHLRCKVSACTCVGLNTACIKRRDDFHLLGCYEQTRPCFSGRGPTSSTTACYILYKGNLEGTCKHCTMASRKSRKWHDQQKEEEAFMCSSNSSCSKRGLRTLWRLAVGILTFRKFPGNVRTFKGSAQTLQPGTVHVSDLCRRGPPLV